MPSEDKPNRINETAYKPKYPYNQVTVTPGGHIIEYDNTPGEERIRWAHKDGTYTEISKGGKKVDYVVGNQQTYNKGGYTMTVDENHDMKVEGHSRSTGGGGGHSEVRGDSAVTIGGDSLTVTHGNMKIAVVGDIYMGTSSSFNLNVAGNLNIKAAGTATIEAGGDMTFKAPQIHLNP